MIISVTDLPSKGYSYNIGSVNINPMTYKEICDYNKELSNTFIQKLYRDIRLLEKDVGENVINEIAYYDLDALMFIKKSYTISKSSKLNISYTCSKCKEEVDGMINTEEIRYTEFDDIVKKISGIKLGDHFKYNIEFPKLGKVKKVCDIFMRFNENIDESVFLLCCCIKEFDLSPNEVKRNIENAVKEDILSIEFITKVMSGFYKEVTQVCPKCGGETVIRIQNLMTDLFRLLRLNIKFDESKIILS